MSTAEIVKLYILKYGPSIRRVLVIKTCTHCIQNNNRNDTRENACSGRGRFDVGPVANGRALMSATPGV